MERWNVKVREGENKVRGTGEKHWYGRHLQTQWTSGESLAELIKGNSAYLDKVSTGGPTE